MNETVLITGASKGIGLACWKLFSEKGYNVAAVYNKSRESAEHFLQKSDPLAQHTLLLKCDVSDSSAVTDAVDITTKTFGKIDVLINNAGVSSSGLFGDITHSEWDAMFAVNVGGTFNFCHSVLPDMIRRHSGKIVNISSIWGITGASMEVCYSSTKAAIIGMTKALAKEVAPSGIHVNCVAPGVIDTDMNSVFDESIMTELKDKTPLGVIGKPEQIAETVYFLSSKKSEFITGQIISPNGGFLI